MIHSQYSHPQIRKFYSKLPTKDNLVLPIFVTENENDEIPIKTLPGISKFGQKNIIDYLKPLIQKGLKSVLIFGVIQDQKLKDNCGSQAFHENGPTQRAIKNIKQSFPNLLIITDVCMCGFTSHGHCGILKEDGIVQNIKDRIDNNKSISQLANIALSHAQAGADMVAPSDMMDGRIESIKNILNKNNLLHVSVMSYSAKFASNLYGPFRDVCNSAPKGDRKCYQMPQDSREIAMKAVERDIQQGADFIMVKPISAYLDIAERIKQKYECILACYHTSGEYSMIHFADQAGAVNKKEVVLEFMKSFRRVGIDIIITYYTPQLLDWLDEQ